MTLLVLFNQPSGGAANYGITANAGSYAVAGVAATIKKTKVLAGAVGAYTYTGVTATVVKASSGAYSITATEYEPQNHQYLKSAKHLI